MSPKVPDNEVHLGHIRDFLWKQLQPSVGVGEETTRYDPNFLWPMLVLGNKPG